MIQKKRVKVDYVGHYETIEKDYNFIRQKIGVGGILPSKNVTARYRDYHKYYTGKECMNSVADIYKDDIKIFGYGF